MDGLDEFEKSLAAEKAERERSSREKEERRGHKHRHHHHHRNRSRDRHHHRDGERSDKANERERDRDRDRERRRHHRSYDHGSDDDDADQHRKRRRREGDDDVAGRQHRSSRRDPERTRTDKDPKDLKLSDPKEDLPLPEEEKAPGGEGLVRDSWMTAPSALDIDYLHRPHKKETTPPPRPEPTRVLHKRELNTGLGQLEDNEAASDTLEHPTEREISYKFGDEGSQWRMTRLKAVYATAEQTGRPVDEVGAERFGSLQDFDDAREEKIEIDRRNVYGKGYTEKEKPTGELYRARGAASDSPSPRAISPSTRQEGGQGLDIEERPQPATLDQTALNRLRAQMMKAKLRNSPDAAQLEAEYNAAARSSSNLSSNPVVLDAAHSRMLAGARGEVKSVDTRRGRERGLVEANEDMSIEDMVREERRTRGQAGGEGKRLAERIAKDGKFDDDLEYLDDNAEKLAKRVHKSETSLKNVAVSEFQKLNRILDTCPLCHHEDRAPPQSLPIAPVISLATRSYLTLPPEPELTGAEGGAVIVPISHRTNLLECDDDEWEEIRNFMKSLTRLYHEQGREVIFYENAAAPQRRRHAALAAVPIPYDLGDTAPAFFKESMLSSDEEWSQHKKIIDTGKRARQDGLGKLAFRRSIAKEMPYFHVWFSLDGGLGHIVEDSDRWPKGDLFAREIIGGMVDCEPDVIKRQGRWTRSDERADGFKKRWRKFDWTRILTEN